ncbi:MAG: ABC transporter ATP-binding protein [Thermodesulfovibrionales bacterium]
MIKISGLEKSFEGQKVLDGLDLTVGERELVAVIGSSGGGKTVLLKHIIGLVKPDAGSIVIDGEDITRLHGRDLDRVRERLGVLFQGGALFDSLTVFQNVAFPLREKTKLREAEIRERVFQALGDVGLEDAAGKYPAELSGGMKKRAALARALITEPHIVLFDEPTTGLDPIILNSIHRLIKSTHLKYGYTGLVISHEIPEIYDIADKVAMIHGGAIVEMGPPEQMRNSRNPVVRHFITGGREGESDGKKV